MNLQYVILKLIAVASSGALAAANILVDDFSVGRHSLRIDPPILSPSDMTVSILQSGLSPARVVGGIRGVTLNVTSGDSGNVGSENNSGPTSMNLLSLSSDSRTSASLVLDYPGIHDMDLTLSGSQVGFAITMGDVDHYSDFLIEVVDGGTTAGYMQNLASLDYGITFNFPFAAFSNPSALRSADSIRITLKGEPAGDYGFLMIKTYDMPDSESSLAVFGLGLVLTQAFSRCQRRRSGLVDSV